MRWAGDVTVEHLLGRNNAHAHFHYSVKPMRKLNSKKHNSLFRNYKQESTSKVQMRHHQPAHKQV